jgi:hypothetical protein
MEKHLLHLLLAVNLAFVAGNTVADATSDAILTWSEEMRAAEMVAPTDHPAVFNSQAATFYIAVFEAVNASTGSQWNTFSGASLPGNARADLAASYAAHTSLSAYYGGSTAAFDAQLAALTADATAEELATARAVGTQAFNAVSSSHSEVSDTFFTTSVDQFLPEPPPAIESANYAEDYIQVKNLGGVDSTERTAEQSDIATFWTDNRTGAMEALLRNAETIIAGQGGEGAEFARGMALFAGGMHDALLAVSVSKSAYTTDRPIVAIHKGDTDGKPLAA